MISTVSDTDLFGDIDSYVDVTGKMGDREIMSITQQDRLASKVSEVSNSIRQRPMMACTRDFELEVYYQDKHGNKYGAKVKVEGEGKETNESDQTTQDSDNKADSRDREARDRDNERGRG